MGHKGESVASMPETFVSDKAHGSHDIELSLIACVSRTDILRKVLLSSPGIESGRKHELIILNNSDNSRFHSIAEAYNEGAQQAKGRYMAFIHQDTALLEAQWVDDLLRLLKGQHFGIAGPSGVVGNHLFYSDSGVLRTNPELAFTEVLRADSLDEALFVVPRAVWSEHRFDPRIVLGFHLCAAEYCLRMKAIGLPVLLVPIRYRHLNLAPADKDLSADGLLRRRHILAWIASAIRLKKAYPRYRIVTPSGSINWRMMLAYGIFYGLFMGLFPATGERLVEMSERGVGQFYLLFNRLLRNVRYRDRN